MGAEASRPAGLSVADFTACFFKVSGDPAKKEPLTLLSSGELPLTADASSVQYIEALARARDPALTALQLAATQADPRVAAAERSPAWWASYFSAVAALAAAGSASGAVTRPVRPAKASDATPEKTSGAPAAPSSDDDEDELLLWDYGECFTYKLPPRPSAAGYVALEWGLENPVLTARIYVTASNSCISIALWTQASATAAGAASAAATAAATGRLSLAPALRGAKLIAVCSVPLKRDHLPARIQPSPDELLAHPLQYYLEPVRDSSRYFVLRTSAGLLGIGFRDRRHSYDLKSALADHLALLARQAGPLEVDGGGSARKATGGNDKSSSSVGVAGGPATPTPSSSSGFELKQGERLVLSLPVKPKQVPSTAPAAAAASSVLAAPPPQDEEVEWGDFSASQHQEGEATPAAAAAEVKEEGAAHTND